MRRLIEIAYDCTPARDEWQRVGAAEHPSNREWGMVLRNTRTGIYAMDSLGSIRCVPQEWARTLDGKVDAGV